MLLIRQRNLRPTNKSGAATGHLFAATDDFLVSTTQLTNAVTARNGPIAAWGALFDFIAGWVTRTTVTLAPLVATVRPRYSQTAKLPADAEKIAVSAAIAHLTDTSRLLYSRRFVSPPTDMKTLVQHCPTLSAADQDNATCIDEGLSSYINGRGNSSRELGTCPACGCTAKTNRDQTCANTRTDDNAQSAIGIGVAGVLLNNSKYKLIAKAIVDYVYTTSGSQERPTNKSDGSRGLVDWFTGPVMVQRSTFWGDNDGTVGISTAALAGLLFDTNEMQQIVPKLLEQVFGLLRTTGKEGFRPASTNETWQPGVGVLSLTLQLAWEDHYQSPTCRPMRGHSHSGQAMLQASDCSNSEYLLQQAF